MDSDDLIERAENQIRRMRGLAEKICSEIFSAGKRLVGKMDNLFLRGDLTSIRHATRSSLPNRVVDGGLS